MFALRAARAIFAMTILMITLTSVTTLAAPKRADEDNLTRSFAEFRKTQISKVDYKVSLMLNKGADEYKGVATIDLELNKTDQPLSIDFTTKKLESLKIGGAAVTDFKAYKHSIEIPAKLLTKKMSIEIAYTSDYDKTGAGFQRVKDPEDASEYMYTDFEPYGAHSFIPCFDQPDLKATFTVTVDAPKEWRIIGNDLVVKADSANDRTVTQLATSKPISTYLFFVGAGPFTEWTDKEGDIPLVLYARKSLAKHVDHKRIFETTKVGLRFFNEYFGSPYPFPKYGQVFIPEFSWGGMENPGAVTLNERGIFRGPVPQSRIDGRDSLILHEMAHMWFGDLVTMKWWNDLWLNESFATYAATLAQVRAQKNEGAWLESFSGKTWGYWQDQLVSTHPIESNVADVRAAKSNLDGITYAKGGASLKQLHFIAGEDGFREGLRSYFKDH
ncbi:MAG: M1 family aminopeptidase, partial [Bdellovibrionota bacterium]